MSLCDGDAEGYWETRAKRAEVERDEAIARAVALETVLREWVRVTNDGESIVYVWGEAMDLLEKKT